MSQIKMIKATAIQSVNVPKYPELKVSSFWKKIQSSPYYSSYFPDYKEGKLPQRDYLFNLLHTIDPELIEDKIMECHRARRLDENKEQDGVIEIKHDLLREIDDSYYFSSKVLLVWSYIESKGRAIYLLKNSADLTFNRKKRVVMDIFVHDIEGEDEEEKE